MAKAKRTLSFKRVDGSAGCRIKLANNVTQKDIAELRKMYEDDPNFIETTRGKITCVCGEKLGCDCMVNTEGIIK